MAENVLSVFVDESGNLAEPGSASRYYIISLVLHDQSVSISEAAKALDKDFAALNLVNICFHAAPIIRGNGMFEILSSELRRRLFSRMMGFARGVDFKYHCLAIDKKYCDTSDKMLEKLGRQLVDFINGNRDKLDGFSKIKVYYDCGQTAITNLLHKHFDTLNLPPVEFAQSVRSKDYKLLQLADLVCTLRLLEMKLETEGRLAPLEFRFFGGITPFKKNIIRRIKKKMV